MACSLACLSDFILSHNWVVALVLFLILIYFVGTYNHNRFKNLGVPYVKPFPVLGNMWKYILGIKRLDFVLNEMYETFSDYDFFGFFLFMKPIYVIKDIELMKKICIKDFDHFLNHSVEFNEDADPIFANGLFVLRDDTWKSMRTVLSPVFTGSKMRRMFSLMSDYCDNMVNNLVKTGNKEMEMKEFFERLANDIVATCIFGIEVDSIKDPDNEFFKNGKELTNMDGLNGMKMFAFTCIPKVMKFFKISLLKAKPVKFFSDIVMNNIDYRVKHNVVRHDMIDLLIQARKQELKFEDSDKKYAEAGLATVEDYYDDKVDKTVIKWTDELLIAQCTVFFFGGFTMSSLLAAFTAYEIAVNTEVQEKLLAEVDSVSLRLGERKLSYEDIQGMKYMDMVVSETLRKWFALFLDRKCCKPYVLEGNDGTKVHLKVGDGIWIANHAIHHDPKYFSDPKKFIPERFSSKSDIDPATFTSFGLGPRNCIGSRFALMKNKAMFYYILTKYRIETSPKMEIPVKLKKMAPVPLAANGMWLKFIVRE